jgi:hypothetical protein
MTTIAIARSLIRTKAYALKKMEEAEDEMDRPVVGTGWARISLGNIITIAAGVIGFVLTIEQMKSDVGTVKEQMTGISGKVDRLQEGQNTETISLKGLSDTVANHDIQLTAHNNRFDAIDVRLRAVEAAMTVFEATQKAQTQAIETKRNR